MIKLESDLSIEEIERLYRNLENGHLVDPDLLLSKSYKRKGIFDSSSYIQYLATWFRKTSDAKILLPFSANELEDNYQEYIEDFFEEELNYVATILGWKGMIQDTQHTSVRSLIGKYTSKVSDKMNSIDTFKSAPLKGNKLFLTCFDHFAGRGGFLNSFYLNKNTFFPGDAFMFSPFSERFSYFINGFNKQLASLNIKPIFEDMVNIIYELMSNTHYWARTDENNKELSPNVRGIYIKFHKGPQKTFIKDTESYSGLNSFFKEQRFSGNTKGELYIIEISVFDSGPGFIRRYAKSRQSSLKEQVRTIKKCLTLHNTTETGQTSITRGVGLDQVLRILDKKGFLRIRTGKCSLYRDMFDVPYKDVNNSDDISLNDWTTGSEEEFTEMAEAEGSLISIIYPYEIPA